jgi:aryl-alcohol dehydrogenase-like predicted oxidoreductase
MMIERGETGLMKYRKLGHSGLVVSALSLGTMQLGTRMRMGGLGQPETDAMVRLAVERGVNLIDTADVYGLGESETLLGNALRPFRSEIVLATKARLPMSDTNINHAGATRVNLVREVEASLRRLQTDYIDLYQVHGWDSITPLDETLRALDDLVRAGKVRYIGLSNYHAWQGATALGLQAREHLNRYVSAQLYYSLVGRDLESDWISCAEYHQLGILVWSPLAGGFLSGKYDRHHPAPPGSRYAEAGSFVPIELDRGYTIIETLRAVAARHDKATPAQVALAWLLTRPAISSVIVAARTNERLAENLGAVDLELTVEDLRALDQVSSPGTVYPRWMVLQLDQAEDPRARTVDPERFATAATPVRDRRGTRWEPT